MGTLPLYWGEADTLGGLVGGDVQEHWARAHLERSYRLEPLDVLSPETLGTLDFLLLAQPRALAPAENVALDTWVRRGGRLLLFADPLLTGETRFPIGDRRRPQDTVLLSPILTHWGLTLQFDEDQRPGPQLARLGGTAIPINLPGRFVADPQASDAPGSCTIMAGQVLAQCAIGEGRVLAVADAAVLDLYGSDPAAPAALTRLLREGFQNAGNRGTSRPGS